MNDPPPPKEPPLPLDYSSAPTFRPKPLYDRLGLHFVAGLGPVAIVATYLTLTTPAARFGNYPVMSVMLVLYTCASIPVILLQFGLLVLSGSIREGMTGIYLEERNGWRTFCAGVLSGVVVFGLGYLAQRLELNDLTAWAILFIPLFIFPLAYPFFLLRPSVQEA
jgi:hypothetical protein